MNIIKVLGTIRPIQVSDNKVSKDDIMNTLLWDIERLRIKEPSIGEKLNFQIDIIKNEIVFVATIKDEDEKEINYYIKEFYNNYISDELLKDVTLDIEMTVSTGYTLTGDENDTIKSMSSKVKYVTMTEQVLKTEDLNLVL